MSESCEKLGQNLFKALSALRTEKGTVSILEAGLIVERLAAQHEVPMKQEVRKLAEDIENAKREILAISTDDKSEKPLSDATLHLDAVIKSTEEATNTIMDAADMIQSALEGIPEAQSKTINDATMRIYEACNFQDLTGQRLTKVIKLMDHIEDRINSLLKLFNLESENSGLKTPANDAEKRSDAHLLNGPQLPINASTQADIDALFGS